MSIWLILTPKKIPFILHQFYKLQKLNVPFEVQEKNEYKDCNNFFMDFIIGI
jgi:hypothetical protein